MYIYIYIYIYIYVGDAAKTSFVVRQLGAQLPYGFEYLGAASQMVATPLTDRCCLTLTQAAQHQMGVAVCGQAGVGKTETLQEVARALGVLCVTFGGGCAQSVGRFLLGVAQQVGD